MTWFFEDEITERTKAILDDLPANPAIAPCLWEIELTNALLVAMRRKRLNQQKALQALHHLVRLPIEVQPPPSVTQLRDTFTVAASQSLTMYDAAYLELARREGVKLATDDEALKAAARNLGVPLC